jgi:hypothetical protein
MFASPFIESVEKLNLGPWLRTILTGLASILALADKALAKRLAAHRKAQTAAVAKRPK